MVSPYPLCSTSISAFLFPSTKTRRVHWDQFFRVWMIYGRRSVSPIENKRRNNTLNTFHSQRANFPNFLSENEDSILSPRKDISKTFYRHLRILSLPPWIRIPLSILSISIPSVRRHRLPFSIFNSQQRHRISVEYHPSLFLFPQ